MKSTTKVIYQAKRLCKEALPFLSALIYGMPCRESDQCDTFAVDQYGRCVFSPEFLKSLTMGQTGYCLCHESFHIGLHHHKRAAAWRPNATEHERLIWNIAADLGIYAALHKDMGQHEPQGIVCPTWEVEKGRKIKDIPGYRASATTEHYADWLLANVKQPNKPPFGGSCADGEPHPGQAEGAGVPVDGKCAEVSAAIEAQEAVKPGSTPGILRKALARRLGKLSDPFKVLEYLVSQSVASPKGAVRHTWMKMPRRQSPGICRRPGVDIVGPRCTVVVDTSGSMNGYVERATAAVAKGLARVHRPRVICWDAGLQSDRRLQSLSQFSWDGGGGTSMDEAVAYADKQGTDAIVVITDGETHWPSHRPNARLVVALVKNSGYATPDYATVVKCYEGVDDEG